MLQLLNHSFPNRPGKCHSLGFEESDQGESGVNQGCLFRTLEFFKGVYDNTPTDMTCKTASDIFDLVNVASIHNNSLPRNVTS